MKRKSRRSNLFEKHALQTVVAIGSLVPILAGTYGIVSGSKIILAGSFDITFDSHFRYLSGLLLAIGLGFLSTLPSIEKNTARFQLLTFIVFIGGLARLISLVVLGAPSPPMSGGLIMELVVTPLLCLWQFRVAKNAGRKNRK